MTNNTIALNLYELLGNQVVESIVEEAQKVLSRNMGQVNTSVPKVDLSKLIATQLERKDLKDIIAEQINKKADLSAMIKQQAHKQDLSQFIASQLASAYVHKEDLEAITKDILDSIVSHVVDMELTTLDEDGVGMILDSKFLAFESNAFKILFDQLAERKGYGGKLSYKPEYSSRILNDVVTELQNNYGLMLRFIIRDGELVAELA